MTKKKHKKRGPKKREIWEPCKPIAGYVCSSKIAECTGVETASDIAIVIVRYSRKFSYVSPARPLQVLFAHRSLLNVLGVETASDIAIVIMTYPRIFESYHL